MTLRQQSHFSHSEKSEDGAIAVLVAISLIPLVLGLAVVVDSGRAWAEKTALQNSVEATTAAAAIAWMKTGDICPSSVLTLLTRDDASPDSSRCTTTGTNANGSIRVEGQDTFPLFFATLFGRTSASLVASTTARIGTAGSLEGVWPIALCEFHPSIVAWRNSGFSLTTNNTITMRDGTSHCGGTASGNWGVVDFNGGSNSNAETSSWVQSGWSEPLDVGDLVPGNPGAVSTSMGIQSIVGQSIFIPLFDTANLNGNNATFRISGFARGVLVSARLTGSSSSRSLTVRFQTAVVNREGINVGSGSNSGITTWAICAQDETGDCT